MRKSIAPAGVILLLGAAVLLAPGAARAEDDDLGWSDIAELSFVLTAGNAESTTLGFNNTLQRKWDRALFELKAGALKVDTTTTLDFAVGTVDDFTVPSVSTTTAENYYLSGRYDRKITDRFYWYAGGGWLRNEFAGIRNRYVAGAGVGNIWVDSEKTKFRTSYGFSYTDQEDVVEIPDTDNSFAGVMVGWNFKQFFGNKSHYGNDLIFNYNLETGSDWRWVMDQWVSVSMSERLALKVTLQWLYNNEPALRQLELRPDATSPAVDTVLVQLDELDTIFGISLVVDF